MNSGFKLFLTALFVLFSVGERAWTSVLEGEWDFSGQMVFEGRVYQKPSSQSGTSQFSIPWMTLQSRYASRDGGELFLEFLGITPVTAPAQEFSLRQGSFFLPQILGEFTHLRAGLLASELSQKQIPFWPSYYLSRELGFSLERWGYQAFSDYGFEIFGSLSENWDWGLQLTNGEGRGQPEKGPNKDLQLWASRQWGEAQVHLVYVSVRRGGYENIPSPVSPKERALVGYLLSSPEGLSGGLEIFAVSDPVDAINGQVAESIDLTDLGGQRVNGQGATVLLRYGFVNSAGRPWSLFLKSSHLQPVTTDRNRDVQDLNFGASYSPRESAALVLYHSQISTGSLHNTISKEQQSWRLALNVDLND